MVNDVVLRVCATYFFEDDTGNAVTRSAVLRPHDREIVTPQSAAYRDTSVDTWFQ